MSSNPFFNLQGPQGRTRPDNLKVTKSSLRFGPLEITRVNTVPPMDYGRPGDVVLIDNTDSPSPVLQSNQTPAAVGMWMKLPLSYSIVPTGNLVAGFPIGFSSVGDIIVINGVAVPLVAPNTPVQAVVDILAAAIPNVSAQVIGEALLISEDTGGALTITDQTGTASQTLGVFSQEALSVFNPNGAWMPMSFAASATGPLAPAAASYLTLAADPNLTNERVLTPGVGINTIDNGAGNTLVVEHDILGVTGLSDPLDPADLLLLYNASTGAIEQVEVGTLVAGGGLTATEGVQQRTITLGTGQTTNIGLPLPAGTVIRRVLLDITAPYSAGTTIEIGDVGVLDNLMEATANDPEEVTAFETTTVFEYPAATQLIATILGTPTAGAGRIIIDFILP